MTSVARITMWRHIVTGRRLSLVRVSLAAVDALHRVLVVPVVLLVLRSVLVVLVVLVLEVLRGVWLVLRHRRSSGCSVTLFLLHHRELRVL